MDQESLFQRLRELINDPSLRYVVIGVGVGALLVLLLVVRSAKRFLYGAFGGGPAHDRGVAEEDLTKYPPPPPAGPKRLTVEGRPVRVRLIVVAPVGKDMDIDVNDVEPMLDQFVFGLGSVAKSDKPRIKVWPSQVSNKGFSFTFNRMMRKAEKPGQPSRWILVAGQTSSRPRPVMLGLALYAEDVNSVGHLTIKPEQWATVLRV